MTLLVAAALSAALFAEAANSTPFDKMSLKGRTDKENPVSYKVGEPIVFTLFTTDIDAVPTNDTYRIRWTRKGDDGKYAEGFATTPVRHRVLRPITTPSPEGSPFTGCRVRSTAMCRRPRIRR